MFLNVCEVSQTQAAVLLGARKGNKSKESPAPPQTALRQLHGMAGSKDLGSASVAWGAWCCRGLSCPFVALSCIQEMCLTTKHIIFHRITEWLGLEGTSGIPQPNPLLKQGHQEQAAQDLVQAGLEYLQRRRLHSLPGQPVPGLRHPQREEVIFMLFPSPLLFPADFPPLRSSRCPLRWDSKGFIGHQT